CHAARAVARIEFLRPLPRQVRQARELSVVWRHPWWAAITIVFVSACAIFAVSALRDRQVDCTAMGCQSAVSVQWDRFPKGARSVRACVDSRCQSQRLGCQYGACKDDSWLNFEELVPVQSPSRPADVSVTFLDGKGKAIRSWNARRRYETNYPNGEDCGDPCFVIGVKISA
ncbi:MAG: hypothetical protein ACRDKE_12175, partial [Solirubrobacterales bacterium]